MKKQPICFFLSSLTGNTKKLCLPLADLLKEQYPEAFQTVTEASQVLDGSPVILCFWCRKSSLDDKSLSFLRDLNNCDILAFGTFGGYPDSAYADLVRKNVREQIERSNRCIGVFLSQGKISEKRTEKRRSLPKDAPHYLDEEGYRRHLESRKHPDSNDLGNAREFLLTHLNEMLTASLP